MEFGGRKIGFREADRRYAELKQKHDAGTLSDEEFESRLRELMVQDEEEGRWWVKSRRDGEWHYYDGNDWVPGTPPGYQPPRTSPAEQSGQGESRPRIRARLILGSAAILAVLALIVGIGWSQLQQSGTPQSPPLEGNAAAETTQQQGAETAQVPDVVGKAPGEAKDVLGANGFEVKIKPDKWSEEWPDGVVVTEQSPGEGEAEKGSTVTITLDYPDGQKPQDQQNQQDQQEQQDYQQDQSGY